MYEDVSGELVQLGMAVPLSDAVQAATRAGDELAQPGAAVPPSDAVPRATTAARDSLQVPLAAAEASAGAATATEGGAEPAPCEAESDELALPARAAVVVSPRDAVQPAARGSDELVQATVAASSDALQKATRGSDELVPPAMVVPSDQALAVKPAGTAMPVVAESVANVAATDDAGLAAAVLTAACVASSSGAGAKSVIDQGTQQPLRSALMTVVMSRCARCGRPGWLVPGFARR